MNELTHSIYWKLLISIVGMSGYDLDIPREKKCWKNCKQWRPWSDVEFCGVWSRSALFANYPSRSLQSTMYYKGLHTYFGSAEWNQPSWLYENLVDQDQLWHPRTLLELHNVYPRHPLLWIPFFLHKVVNREETCTRIQNRELLSTVV